MLLVVDLPYKIHEPFANMPPNSKIASEYDQRFARSFTPVLNEIQENLDFIGVKKGGRFLDYACGTGFMSIVSTVPEVRSSRCVVLIFGIISASERLSANVSV